MKKFLIFIFLLIPGVAFSVPSVRMLGSNSGTKITPAKTVTVPSTTNNNANKTKVSRLGSVRLKNVETSGAITASGTRFPVISTTHYYNSTNTPETTGASSCGCKNVDIDAVVDTIVRNVESNYYNKADVYNTDEFVEAVKDIDDPRIDAIRTVRPNEHHSVNLPSDYVYVWIEE
nr:hypothetical protein [Candidatus Enterousia merdequi]